MIEVTPKDKPIIGKVSEMNKPQPQPERKRPRKGRRNLNNRRPKGHAMTGNKPEIIFAAFAGLAILALKGMVDREGRFHDDIEP